MSNYTNLKCLCGWYEIYDIEEINSYVYDPDTSTYMEKNAEILTTDVFNLELFKKEEEEKETEDITVYMDEVYMEDTDTEDTESTRVMVDMGDLFYISSDEEEDEYDSPV